jgi:hypothetical protein
MYNIKTREDLMESKTGCMIHALDLKQCVTIWASHEGERERKVLHKMTIRFTKPLQGALLSSYLMIYLSWLALRRKQESNETNFVLVTTVNSIFLPMNEG